MESLINSDGDGYESLATLLAVAIAAFAKQTFNSNLTSLVAKDEDSVCDMSTRARGKTTFFA